jgi:6-phosphogluconolactonase
MHPPDGHCLCAQIVIIALDSQRMNHEIQIFKDLASLSRAAADLFLERSSQAIRVRGRALIVISGGSTPLGLFRLLADEPIRDQINWQALHIFWADERCVPADHPESNYGQARNAFLEKVPIQDENIHRLTCDGAPVEAANAYADTLREFREPPLDWPRFDLVFLGMGDDGHTASLFPGSEVDVPTPTMAVIAHYQGRPANRITLTPKVFNAAKQVVFLVSGESKEETLARVLDEKDFQPELFPAQRIRPLEGRVIWMVDRAAASKLPKEIKS